MVATATATATPTFAKTFTTAAGVITELKLWKRVDSNAAIATVVLTGRTKLVRTVSDSLMSLAHDNRVIAGAEKVEGGWREVQVLVTLAAVADGDMSETLCSFLDSLV